MNTNTAEHFRTFIVLFLASLTVNCTGGGFVVSPVTATPVVDETLTTTPLSTGTYTDGTGTVRNFELLKVAFGSGSPTFIQWIPTTAGSASPTVLIYLQYDGINWTGLTVDVPWAARSAGSYADSDAPYYNASTSAPISYYGTTSTTDSGSLGFIYSYNNMNVAIVFGRFYVGGDLQNDIDDAKNGIRFLHSQALVDKTKIGLFGNSWGGMALLHGAAQLGATKMPKAISVLYPAADIKALNTLMQVTIPAAAPGNSAGFTTFYEPYLRRINKSTEALAGQATRYDKYSLSALSGITSDLFVSHDAWDTIVPISVSNSLLSTVSSTSKIHFYQSHQSAVDYTTFSVGHSQGGGSALNTEGVTQWSYIFLLNKLMGTAPRTAMVRTSVLVPQFQYVKSMHDLAVDTSYFNGVLAQLCTANLSVKELDSGNTFDGPTIFNFLMEYNYASGWAADGPSACAKLITNPPF